MPGPNGTLGQFRRGTWAERQTISTPPFTGEPLWDTDFDYTGRRLYVGSASEAYGVVTGWHTTPQCGQKNNYWYGSATMFTAYVTSTVTPNFITYRPIYLGGNDVEGLCTVKELTCEVTTGQTASCRMALYASHELSGEPDELIIESGALNTKFTGVLTYTTTTVVPPGWYWLAFNTDATTAAFRCEDNLATGTQIGTASNAYVLANLYYEAHTFGAFPATAAVDGVASLDSAAMRVKVGT